MPLFKCTKCGCIDNTAVAHYWATMSDGSEPLCSECHTGKWHGIFKKQTPEEMGMIQQSDGFYGRPDQ